MRNLFGILSVSFMAIVVVNSAYGALASKGYVDQYKFDMVNGLVNANKVVVTNGLGKVSFGDVHTDERVNVDVAAGAINVSANVSTYDEVMEKFEADDPVEVASDKKLVTEDVFVGTVAQMNQMMEMQDTIVVKHSPNTAVGNEGQPVYVDQFGNVQTVNVANYDSVLEKFDSDDPTAAAEAAGSDSKLVTEMAVVGLVDQVNRMMEMQGSITVQRSPDSGAGGPTQPVYVDTSGQVKPIESVAIPVGSPTGIPSAIMWIE